MGQKGFTLIELIMVIAILGILAVAAMPSIFDLTDEATTASRDGIVGAVKSGLTMFGAQQMAMSGMASYPSVLEGGVGPGAACGNSNPGCFENVLKEGVKDQTRWWKTAAREYLHVPSGTTYEYISTTGTFTEK